MLILNRMSYINGTVMLMLDMLGLYLLVLLTQIPLFLLMLHPEIMIMARLQIPVLVEWLCIIILIAGIQLALVLKVMAHLLIKDIILMVIRCSKTLVKIMSGSFLW